MPDELTPPDVDTSAPVQNAPVSQPAAPTQDNPGIGTRILGALSGGLHDSSYQVDPSGQMQKVTNPDVRKPGDMFRGLLATMLNGLSGAGQAQANGQKGFGAGMAAGAAAQQKAQQQKVQQQKSDAQDTFNDKQKVQAAKAAFVKSQDEHAMNTFQMAKEGTTLQAHEAEQSENLAKVVRDTPGAEYKGFYKDFDSLVSQLKDPNERQELMQARAKGELVQHQVVGLGPDGMPKVLGVDFYKVPTAYMDKPTDRPVTYYTDKIGKDGVATYEPIEIKAGQLSNREAISISQKPLTGAITPKDQFEAAKETEKSDKQIQANKELHLSEFAQQRTMEGIRANDAVNLAKQKGEILDSGNIASLVDSFGNYHGDVKDFNRLDAKTGGALRTALVNKYPDWNEQTYEASQKALDSAAKGSGAFAPLQPSDQAIQHTMALHKLVNGLPPTSDVGILNRAIQGVARQTGNTDIANLDQLVDAVAHETANARAKGHADVHSIAEARKNIDLSKGTAALKASLESSAKIQHDTMNSMAGELERQVPGVAGRPNAPGISNNAQEALKHFGLDNPFDYGQGPKPSRGANSISQAGKSTMDEFMKLSGGDPKKAWALAQKRGWAQ